MNVTDQDQAGSRRVRTDLVAIVGVMLLASVLPVDLLPSTQHEARGADGQLSGKQGQVIVVRVPVSRHSIDVTGRFLGRRVPFFHQSSPSGPGAYLGLLGIDMLDTPGTHELVVDLNAPGESRRLSYHVLVIQEDYPVQRLTLPKRMVDLDPNSLVRVKAEQKQVRSVLNTVSQERFWSQPFIEPVLGAIAGAFGRKRIINGQPRSPHNGEDIAAPLGTEVLASNDGVVRLAVDHFFSGKGVLVDHGLGLYSMYFHLSEVSVQDGEPVTRGHPIGKVGATGRATGPHLHWGVRLNGARVNPYALINLPLLAEPRSEG